ncbi:MAG: DUF3147 family protein [Turneriella sp.]
MSADNNRYALPDSEVPADSSFIVAASELAKRSDRLGARIVALPLMTVMTLFWMHAESQPTEKIANHAWYTFCVRIAHTADVPGLSLADAAIWFRYLHGGTAAGWDNLLVSCFLLLLVRFFGSELL